MDKLELLLSILPSIINLDLASSGRPFEFVRRLSQWEGFIRLKLPQLYRFEFCIFCYCSNWENFESLIAAFRTSFWLEEKRWFVTCQFRDDWTSNRDDGYDVILDRGYVNGYVNTVDRR
ncbi:unnamed protein product [Rotaria sordida]|uniref:Uncharacterized protein n=1 Tax=Rotaria sordida TaxID=392033 RepID=A0A815M5I3_9BILA|nr:unnamed protein product [Rotaria sordida]CAF4024621.1 unnamed protein product [Rotaria sordida]